jgi:ZIP family zinc transporter
MTIILIAIAVAVFTLLGGLFALRFHDKMHLIVGFSAGAVIGVAFFDLIPESIEMLGSQAFFALTLVVIGFIIYMIIDRFVVLHSHHEHGDGHIHEKKGLLGAGSLAIHSFLDGLAIGLAFQVSAVVGGVIAIAVLAHDFSDGINIVSVILKNGGTRRSAFRFLLVDAGAPVLGILVTLFFQVPERVLGIILAIFAGFFLYIGASDLIPESHHAHPAAWTTISTILGIFFIYGVIWVAQ